MARYDLNLSHEEFLETTPAQYFALVDRANSDKRDQDYRAGIIASNIVRVFAKAEDSGKCGPEYFFPSLKTEEQIQGERFKNSPEGMKRHLQTFYPPKKGKK